MPRFLINFEVEQRLLGAIEVEAESPQAASDAFYRGDYDDARLSARLEIEDSEDAVFYIEEQKSPHGFV